jgi:hypothetical protein
MKTETKRKVREALRVFDNTYTRGQYADHRLLERGQRDEALRREIAKLKQELETSEGYSERKEARARFKARLMKMGYDEANIRRAEAEARGRDEEGYEGRRRKAQDEEGYESAGQDGLADQARRDAARGVHRDAGTGTDGDEDEGGEDEDEQDGGDD